MAYWRMQLHPADPDHAMQYAVESVAAGFIGLDFAQDPGDLTKVNANGARAGERDYWDFALAMAPGDHVLVIVHHFPFALVVLAGDYNYVKTPVPELGVWFRHFRRINRNKTIYWADRAKDARGWEQFIMTDTLSPLKNASAKSYRLIEQLK